MKLKKVTALLLATSMVLSSVSVGTFADELIFEPEVSATTEAGEDEAYFGEEGEVVVNEQTATDDEAFFSDEVIEDDVVTEDENIADTADEAVDYAFVEGAADEPIADENADVYAALENTEQTVTAEVDYDITGDMSYKGKYDGQEHGLDKSKAGVDKIRFRHPELEPSGNTDYSKMVWTDESPTFKHVKTTDENTNKYTVQFQIQTLNPAGEWVWPSDTTGDGNGSQDVVIEPASISATLSNKTFKKGDTVPTLTVADYTFSGLQGTDTAETKFTINDETKAISVANYSIQEWDGTAWRDATFSDVISGGKFIKTGRFTFKYSGSASTAFTEKYLTDDGQYDGVPDYTMSAVNGGEFTVEQGEKKEITVFWPEDKTYTGDPIEYAPSLSGYTFTLTSKSVSTAKDVDTYYCEIDKVFKGSEDVTADVTVTNPTHEWKITKAKAFVFVETPYSSFEYGVKDPAANLKIDNIKLYKKKDRTGSAWATSATAVKALVTGNPEFETTYMQYDPVYSFNGTTTSTAWYYIRYKSGLESKNLELIIADDDTTGHLNGFSLTPAYVKVVPNNITATFGAEPVEPTYSLENVNKDSGAADALKHDIDAKKVTLSVYTVDPATADTQAARYGADKVTPSKVAKYKYGWKLEDATPNTGLNRNFVVFDGNGEYDGSGTNSTIDTTRLYVVNEGEFNLKFSDYEGVYDGKPHGIIVEPDPLPTGVTVYYSTAAMTLASGEKVPTAAGGAPVQAEPITYTDPTDPYEVVYYYVVSDGLGSGLNGYNKITIKDADKAAAEAVEKQIEEATTKDAEGKYDPAKVKAAREAYDALTNDQKAMVDQYDVKALKDAEAAIAASAEADAKEVEDKIAALPDPENVTEADADAIMAAKDAYDNLSDDAKAKVSKDAKDKLDADIAALEGQEEADKKAAKAVEDEIDALPEASEAKASDKEAADKAVEDYNALTDAQKALVPADKVEKMNAVKAAADAAAEEDEKAEKERELFDEAVALVKAQKNGVDGKAAAENAKKAYDNLSDAAKAKLTDEEIKAYEDAQKAYTKDYTFNSGEGVFRVLSNGEVTYLKPLHPENTWFVVPNQLKKNGFTYKVVKVSTKAFMGCTKATKIKIGKNVQSIGAYAFKNTPAMTKLIMLTSKLASGKVTNSFGGAGKEKGAKLTNEVPNGKSSAYESLFKGEGGMNAKAKFTENN